MTMKRTIHTTISREAYDKLVRMGEGQINTGIMKALQIAESKQHDTREALTKIADRILSGEYGLDSAI